MKSILNYLLYAGFAVFFGLQLWIRFGTGEKGDAAPNFSTELVDGKEFELEDLRGNYVVLDFWGSWCRPCLAENPKLVALYDKYKHRQFTDADGFKVVTVALEKKQRYLAARSPESGILLGTSDRSECAIRDDVWHRQ